MFHDHETDATWHSSLALKWLKMWSTTSTGSGALKISCASACRLVLSDSHRVTGPVSPLSKILRTLCKRPLNSDAMGRGREREALGEGGSEGNEGAAPRAQRPQAAVRPTHPTPEESNKAIKQSRARATITRRTARLSERSFTAMSQCLYGWPKTPPRVAALVHPRSLPLTAQLLIPPLTSISCEWATSIRVATAQPCRCLAISLVPSKPPTRSRRLRATTVRYDCTARR